MSTTYSRYFDAGADYTAGNSIDDRDIDGEFDAMVTALNRKALIKGTAPSSPIEGQTWYDSTNKLLKVYRNSEWFGGGLVHVSDTAPTTPQDGDVWSEKDNDEVKVYNGSAWLTLDAPANLDRIGLELSRTDKDTLSVSAGIVYHGSTRIAKTAATSLALGTDATWINDTSLRGTDDYGYVYINASGDIRLHTSVPDKSTAAAGTVGRLRFKSLDDGDGAVYWRLLGWFYMNGTGSGEVDTYGFGQFKEGDTVNSVIRTGTSDITTTETAYTDMTDMEAKIYTTGHPVLIQFSAPVNGSTISGTPLQYFNIEIDGTDKVETTYRTPVANAPFSANLLWLETLSQGEHTVKVQWKTTEANTLSQEGETEGDRVMTVIEQ